MDIARRLVNAVLMATAATVVCYAVLLHSAQAAQPAPLAVVPAVVLEDGSEVDTRNAYWLQPVSKEQVLTLPATVLLLTAVGALALANNRSRLIRKSV